jgi:hypothetical protein|tara:strand:+ start:152 stop:544 length:393 start_codon:yes stop_codon:yes gene_type:complete
MKNITLLTISLGLLIVALMLFGCACADNFIEESLKEPPQPKPDAVFDDISTNTWGGLKKEIALNGITMGGDMGTVSRWGISVEYKYADTILVLHKINVGFPASWESLGGWTEERVLNLIKEKLIKHGAEL